MARKRLITDKEYSLIIVSSIYGVIISDYPWFKKIIEENFKSEYKDIEDDRGKQEFFENRYQPLLKEAASEWGSHPTSPVEIVSQEDDFRCQICNHQITNVYTIVNRLNGNELRVGSECVKHFGICSDKDVKKLLEDQKKSIRLNFLDKELPGIENEIKRWNDDINQTPLLLPNSIVIPYLRLGDRAKSIFDSFIEEKSNGHDDAEIINELRDAVERKKATLTEVEQYAAKNKNDVFVPKQVTMSWLESMAVRNPQKYEPRLQRLKEVGRVELRTAFLIGEPNFLISIMPLFNVALKDVGWKIEKVLQYKGTYGFVIYISQIKLSVFSGHEIFLQEFGDAIFEQEETEDTYSEKKLLINSDIIEPEAVYYILQTIEDFIPIGFGIHWYDNDTNDIVFRQEIDIAENKYRFYMVNLKKFIDRFKYTILQPEKECMDKDINKYFSSIEKEKSMSKEDESFLRKHRDVQLWKDLKE